MTNADTPLDVDGATRVILWVADFDASVAFYRDTLGLPLAYPPGGGWAEFRTTGPALCLHEGRAHEHSTHHVASFGWAVRDLDATVVALRARGVDIQAPVVVSEHHRSAEFADPSDNALFVEGP